MTRTITSQPTSPYRSTRASRDDATLVGFVAIALGIMFAVGGAIVALDIAMDSPAYLACYAMGLLSPFVASLFYAWRTAGSLAPIRRMYWPLRIGTGGWMILAVPLSLTAAYLVAAPFGLPLTWDAASPVSTLLIAALGWSAIMWAEETGWRGTLLPALQSRAGPLAATIGVGLVWAVWHLPLLYLVGMEWGEVGLFTLQVLGLSAVMTWAFNRSQTVLVPVLIHGVGNATGGWLLTAVPTMSANELIGVQAAGPLVLGLALVVVTAGQLGYRSAVREPAAGSIEPVGPFPEQLKPFSDSWGRGYT